MSANFNNAAWFYDGLARLVYGKALIDAQRYLLQLVPPEANMLIVGGGTGWILEELAKIRTGGLLITYVEVSAKMMTLSKKRKAGNNQLTFINDAVENVKLTEAFDVVITPFLFDNFTEATFQKVFDHIHLSLKPGGLWLNGDFNLTGKWWQGVLLKSMFVFFRIVCGIEASKLPEIEKRFSQYRYKEIAGESFFGDFIVSQVFGKI